MKLNDLFSKVFCVVNGIGLLVGLYLWTEYSLFRVVILYSLFNIILFWLTEPGKKASSGSVVPRNLVRLIPGSVSILFACMIMATSRSIFVRPIQVPLILGAILVLCILVALANGVDASEHPPFLSRSSVQIFIVLSIVLYVYFSIYLVQPSLMDQPSYGTMDAYRDYTNAYRILEISRIDPEKMILQRYFRPFPVVPVEIAIVNLITNLPLNVGHLVASMISEMLTLVCCVGLSGALIRKHQVAWSSKAGTLSILVLLLQPMLIDPGVIVGPLRFSVSILSLIFYLCYSRRLHKASLNRSVTVSIILLIFVIIPLHATTSMFLVLILALLSLFRNGSGQHSTKSFMRLSVITFVCFLMYLTFPVVAPFRSLVQFAEETFMTLKEILTGGITVISEKALQTMMPAELLELSLFLQTVGMSLLVSVSTVFLLRMLQRRHEAQDSGLSLFHICCGVLVVVGISLGRLLPLWQVPAGYVVFPLIPVAMIGVSFVIRQILMNLDTARRFALFGVLVLYVSSIVFHPSFLYETHVARLLPTTSENAAALFVQDSLPIGTANVEQVVTDFPFNGYVRALLYSHNIGLENVVDIATLMYNPMRMGHESIILSRRYFLESPYLRTVSPYMAALCNVDKWQINRVCDVGSTSVYAGTPR